MVNGLQKIFPKCETEGMYLHPGSLHIQIAKRGCSEESLLRLNTYAHLCPVILVHWVTIPIVDGEAQFGEFGRIYF